MELLKESCLTVTLRPFSTTDPFPAVKSYTLTPSPDRHSSNCWTQITTLHTMTQLLCCCPPIDLYWSSGILRFFSSLVNLYQDTALQHMQMCRTETGHDKGRTQAHQQHLAARSELPACMLALTTAIFSCPQGAVCLLPAAC